MKSKRMNIGLIIIILLMMGALFMLLDSPQDEPMELAGENGVWDLRAMPFGENSYWINGPVEYIPNVLLTPEEYLARVHEADVGHPQNVAQFATSRIRILVPDDGYYAFYGRSIDYSERMYVNGEWMLDIGTPGSTKETTVPNTGKIMLTLKAENGVIEVIQQSSNFMHRHGDTHAGWVIRGGPSRLSVIADLRESVKLGFFLALFLVHIILYILHRSYKVNLYFALFCLMWFLRTGVTGSKIFTDIFPWLTWVAKFRIEYMSFPVTAVMFMLLLGDMFPGILQSWFRYALIGISIPIALLFLLADTVFMSHALLWCEAVYIPAILYIIVRFILKLRCVQMEQGLFLAGLFMFFLTAVHAMLYYNDIFMIHMADLTAISMLMLTFCEAAAVFIATVREMGKAAAENALLKENVRMTERQVDMQRTQYLRLMENVARARHARHDMRHQLAAIGRLSGEEPVKEYVEKLLGALPNVADAIYCENAAVNAVVNHYASLAANEGAALDIRLHVPENTGRIVTMDLCVLTGNLLENAVEAISRMHEGEKFIRVRSRIQAGGLSIVVENSFDGIWDANDGVYVSRKQNHGEAPRSGLGLSSIQAICDKYDGMLKVETHNRTWKVAALLEMNV